ncbi:hypothetical protein SLEP1_g43067 [Rubroshorea leprosula]|uniref:Uncharacterized protein n=1 Tax=Rubroshorea leprosula TaxID=152421 RepID=A0AAV5LBT5_9ROSI|nr:hypothetical protein SLEP1_g43067 [Rubroshorea leprosula]
MSKLEGLKEGRFWIRIGWHFFPSFFFLTRASAHSSSSRQPPSPPATDSLSLGKNRNSDLLCFALSFRRLLLLRGMNFSDFYARESLALPAGSSPNCSPIFAGKFWFRIILSV